MSFECAVLDKSLVTYLRRYSILMPTAAWRARSPLGGGEHGELRSLAQDPDSRIRENALFGCWSFALGVSLREILRSIGVAGHPAIGLVPTANPDMMKTMPEPPEQQLKGLDRQIRGGVERPRSVNRKFGRSGRRRGASGSGVSPGGSRQTDHSFGLREAAPQKVT